MHLWLVLKRGVSEPPVPGQVVDPNTYDARYEKELQTGVPFLGTPMLRDALVSALAVILVVALAAVIGPKGPSGPPDPTLSGANPRPEWPFLWLFALLSLSPPAAETFIMLVFPGRSDCRAVSGTVRVAARRTRPQPPARRRAVGPGVSSPRLACSPTRATAPWSPKMTAWSGDPVPKHLLEKRSPRQLQGAAVLQVKQCRNCHALEGLGGQRGPDLTSIGGRMTRDQLIDQISNGTPGGGNMPAFGKQMTPAEMDALVDFLTTLRREGQPPAEPPTRVAGPVAP